MVFLPFDQPLELTKAQPNLAATIFAAEASAILNWAIDGLLRLLSRPGIRRERFTLPEASREAADQHRRDSNPVADWMEEHVQIDADFALEKDAAYKDFRYYLEHNGHGITHPLRNKAQFVKAAKAELQRLGVAVGKDDRHRLAVQRIRVFFGVRLTTEGICTMGNYCLKAKPVPPADDPTSVVTASSGDLPATAA